MEQDFKRGFINEFAMKANQNGVESFQLENALGTATHAVAGYFAGKGIMKLVNASRVRNGKEPIIPIIRKMIGDKSNNTGASSTPKEKETSKKEDKPAESKAASSTSESKSDPDKKD